MEQPSVDSVNRDIPIQYMDTISSSRNQNKKNEDSFRENHGAL